MTQDLQARIVEIAHVRRRFGYRRIHDLLRPSHPGVNHKRVYRLYSSANLAVRKRKKVRLPASERVPLELARAVNECVDIAVDWGISGEYVTRGRRQLS